MQFRMSRLSVCIAAAILVASASQAQTISTVTGNGTWWAFCGDGGPATSACLSTPSGIALAADGSLFIADTGNQRIRKVDPAGTITTVAGNGTAGFCGDGGPAASACLYSPTAVVLDASGALFIADHQNYRVRKVTAAGTITTVAGNGTAGYCGDGGPATSACLNNTFGLAVNGAGDLFIADTTNNRIRMVNTTGTITTVAGNGTNAFCGDGGPATSACLDNPWDVVVEADGTLIIADEFNHRIRRVDPSGTITTLAGSGIGAYCGDGGPATSGCLQFPFGVLADGSGAVLVADTSNHRIRLVDAGGTITTVAGNGSGSFCGDGGPATSACLNWPSKIALSADAMLFIADQQNHRIRKVDLGAPANTPPIAEAGSIDPVEASGTLTAVTLDGSASSDPDGDPLTYAWTSEGTLLGETAILTVLLGLGTHVLTLTVDDGRGGVASDAVEVIVRDTTAPAILITVPAAGTYRQNEVVVAFYTCSDTASGVAACAGPVPSGMPIETSALGDVAFAVIASDDAGNTTSLSVTYTVVPDPGTWTLDGNLVPDRTYPAAVLFTWGPLAGKVLVAGGHTDNPSSVCNIYDPETGAWRTTGWLNLPRYYHRATLLPSGKVLVTGGLKAHEEWGVTSAELYDPVTETWTPTGSMNVPRAFYHTATLLPTGKVLVAGGYSAPYPELGYTDTAELFDPATGTWELTGRMSAGRAGHSATLLRTGKVLVAGGSAGWFSAELYDPAVGTWATTGSLIGARAYHAAELLPDGRVLVAGGFSAASGAPALNTAELYDPATGAWSATGSMLQSRYWFPAVGLRSGLVLVAGGLTGPPYVFLSSAELYDPAAGSWRTAGNMWNTRWIHAAVRLPAGAVLVAGGLQAGSDSRTELYMPAGPANTKPTADAGAAQTVEATGPTTPVELSGTGADAESGTLEYTWRDAAGTVVGTSAAATVALPLGTHVFTLTVDDGESWTASDTVTVVVRDTVPPTATIVSPAETFYSPGAVVIADFACSDGGSGLASCTGTVGDGEAVDTVSPGPHVFTATATDRAGNIATASVTYTVKGIPTITWPPPADIVYGTALGAAQLNAVADVPGSFSYDPPAGTTLGAGAHTLTVTFTPADSGWEVTTTAVPLVVIKATPVLTWAPPSDIVYGTPLGAAQLNASADVSGSFSYTPAAGTMLGVGTHVLRVSFAPTDAANYVGATREVPVTVRPAPLTIRADDQAMVLNGPLPPLTATYIGFVNGETAADLDAPVMLSTSATGGVAGPFPIVASGAADPNYTLTFVPGTLWVRYAAGGLCLGQPSHVVLSPIDPNGSSVFRRGSTVQVKFRLADVNGTSIGTPGVVVDFRLYQVVMGNVVTPVNTVPDSATRYTAFRWSAANQQWVFSLSTKKLSANATYYYRITLNDGSVIEFRFGLR
jgi:sugar lactone lactonase YvrE